MPFYEFSVIYKIMNKPDLVSAIKRTAGYLWERGGLLRKIENFGTRNLPYKISAHGANHKQGNFIVFYFALPPDQVKDLREVLKRDIDAVRAVPVKHKTVEPFHCTLGEELLPPAYRSSVQKRLVEGKKNKKRLFKPFELVNKNHPF